MQIKSISSATPRVEKRVLGGYVHFASRDVHCDKSIFDSVDEVGPLRVVRKDTELHKALTGSIGRNVGGEPIIVKSCKNEFEFTIEYKRGYGTSTSCYGG